jgi:hypothetical protein
LEGILFADETTLFLADLSYTKHLSRFREYFNEVFVWINHIKLFLNWSKTKFMIINSKKAGARHPPNIEIEDNLIEVVSDFKLLGCTIDNKLHFDKHVKNLKFSVCSKLFCYKKFYLFIFSISKSTFSKPFYFHILTIAHRYLFIYQIFWLIN